MFCTNCGKALADNCVFCTGCGKRVAAPAPQPQPQYAPPQPQYVQPQPQYEAPQPQYEAPQPQYEAPQPQYEVPQPQYAPQPQYMAQPQAGMPFVNHNDPVPAGCIYSIEGVRGRHIDVYENKAVITVKATFGSFMTGNITDGEKTIFYSDCVGVQFKKSGFAIGYLQLETATAMMNSGNSNFFGENSFTFDTKKISNEKMEEIANYIRGKVEEIKTQKNTPSVIAAPVSAADEIKKLKELLDLGILTQEEFDAKKKQLLGI